MSNNIITKNRKLIATFFGGFVLFLVGLITGGYAVHKDYENDMIPQYKVLALQLIHGKKDLLEKNAELRHDVLRLIELSEKQAEQLKEYRDASLKEGQAK